jgi:hypothetical protein
LALWAKDRGSGLKYVGDPQPHLHGSIQIAADVPFRIDNGTGLVSRHQIGAVGYSGDEKLLYDHSSSF